MRKLVCDLEHRVRLAKANVEQISAIMAGWSQAPLYQRKEDRKDCLLGLEVIYLYIRIICIYSCVSVLHYRKGVGSIVNWRTWN